MLDEAVVLLSNYLKDADNGANALAQILPRLPGVPAPPVVTLENDVENEGVARDLDPSKVPALVLWGDSAADIDVTGKRYKVAKEIVVAAAYITDDGADALVASRDRNYILRAAMISLSRYNSQDVSKNYRELNGIRVLELTTVTEQRITAAVGRRKMWGWLEIRATVIETLQ